MCLSAFLFYVENNKTSEFWQNFENIITSENVFRCVSASIFEGLSIRPLVRRSMGPSASPSVGPSVRPLVRLKRILWIWPVKTKRLIMILVHPYSCDNNDHNHHGNYTDHNDHNETTKKRRRIFVRLPNLFRHLSCRENIMEVQAGEKVASLHVMTRCKTNLSSQITS